MDKTLTVEEPQLSRWHEVCKTFAQVEADGVARMRCRTLGDKSRFY